MKKKQIFRTGCLLVLLTVGMLFAGCGKEEGYRLMQVYQVKGQAEIERENIGSMDAYENLNLITGDKVNIELESFMRLKVDEDKYVLAEEDSVFHIYATGKDKNAKTDIRLEKGTITVEVQNKLAEGASFEVTTPNSVMAVRGTVFRISADVDENGKPITVIAILEGEVEVQEKDENGNLSGKQSIEKGQEAIVYEKSEELVIVVSDEIDMNTIPTETLEFLKEIAEERRELSVTQEELDVLIEEKKKAEAGENTQNQDEENSELVEETEGSEQSDGSEIASENASSNKPSNPKPSNKPVENQGSTDNAGAGNDEDSIGDAGSGSNEGSTEGSGSGSDEGSTEDTEPGIPKVYTVTFQYKGTVFGTQKVEEGKMVSKPKLMPAASGNWNYDFSIPVDADIVIEFVE